MSTEYKEITDRLVAILETHRNGKLSEDLSADVVAIKKGQYTPGDASVCPTVYARPARTGLIAELSGKASRLVKMKFMVSGSCMGDTQAEAIDDAQCLMNNLEHVLENYSTETNYWSGGMLGWSSDLDEDGTDFNGFDIEPSQNRVSAHFTLMWSCDVRIGTDSL